MIRLLNRNIDSQQIMETDPNEPPPLWAILILPLVIAIISLRSLWALATGSRKEAEL
jgi:hypothetical protein